MMITLTGILVPAVLATLQRPVAPRHIDPRAIAPRVLVPLPVAARGPLSSYEGLWIGSDTDSSLRRRVSVEGLHIRVLESCLPSGDGECTYESDAVAYRPLRAAPTDSTVAALAVEYGGPLWRQSLILRQQLPGHLEAFVYTTFPESAKRRDVYEHQLLMPVSFQVRRPPPFAVGPPMPQFPWPPPPATATLRLPDKLVAIPGSDSLGAVFARLLDELRPVYVDWSVYAIGSDGFAVVTEMEAIDPDGRPKPVPERWSGPNNQVPPHISGIADYLKALFSARAGFYRIIVFAVTSQPSQSGGAPISADSAKKLLRGGTDQLPMWLRQVRLGVDGRCLALIYEFEKPNESDPPRMVTSATISAAQHLTLAGLWNEQVLGR